MAEIDFISSLHKKTARDYLARVMEHDKAECAEIALQWGRDYWDGARHLGYGGYHYDGRWRPVAEALVKHYELPRNARILDVGCGKGFLLYELNQVLPSAEVTGIDISQYAIEHSKEEIRDRLQVGDAASLPFADKQFDLVITINALHNLYVDRLFAALQEIERVGRSAKYLVVESYRSEREKVNLLYWQLTCRSFYTPHEWEWWFEQTGYTGDHSFIFFE
jgi:SAM-dependent methyltransferase